MGDDKGKVKIYSCNKGTLDQISINEEIDKQIFGVEINR